MKQTAFGFCSDVLETTEVENTAFATSQGALVSEYPPTYGTSNWWLRYGLDASNVPLIFMGGAVGSYDVCNKEGIRPAIYLDSSSDGWSYAGTVSSDSTADEEVVTHDMLKMNPRIENGVTTWTCMWFGNYPQSSDGNGGFKTEPIKWRVLSVEGNDAFLLAEKNLDVEPYNEENTDVTWENCTLRNWLNDDFYNSAFNSKEKQTIILTDVINDDNFDCGTEGGNHTEDNIFLLSLGEVTNEDYGFPNSFLDSEKDKTRRSTYTDYVEQQAERKDTLEWWRLRSPGYYQNCSADVSHSGAVMYGSGVSVDYAWYAVRPALHIDLSSDTWSYAGIVSCDGIVTEYDEKTHGWSEWIADTEGKTHSRICENGCGETETSYNGTIGLDK